MIKKGKTNQTQFAPSIMNQRNEIMMNVAELAIALDTDARTARKFLRSITPKDAQPGKGSRWAIDAKVATLRKEFAAYTAARAPKAPEGE